MRDLTFVHLLDYPLKSVEAVQRGAQVLGLIEKQNDGRYKAFAGSGFTCKYIKLCNGRQAAVEAIERAAAQYE